MKLRNLYSFRSDFKWNQSEFDCNQKYALDTLDRMTPTHKFKMTDYKNLPSDVVEYEGEIYYNRFDSLESERFAGLCQYNLYSADQVAEAGVTIYIESNVESYCNSFQEFLKKVKYDINVSSECV